MNADTKKILEFVDLEKKTVFNVETLEVRDLTVSEIKEYNRIVNS